MEVCNRTSSDFWDDFWVNAPYEKMNLFSLSPKIFLKNYHYRKVFNFLKDYFEQLPQNAKVLEIGCGNSQWLPFLAYNYGFKVAGIDYSVNGCELAKRNLDNASVLEYDIIHSDFLKAPKKTHSKYDLCLSFGVAEHFDDLDSVIKVLSTFVNDEGYIVTGIPNMTSFYGRLQKFFNKEIYELHNPLTLKDLSSAYKRNNLTSNGKYLYNFNMNNISPNPKTKKFKLYKILNNRLSKLIFVCMDIIMSRVGLNNEHLSSYVVIIGKKREEI